MWFSLFPAAHLLLQEKIKVSNVGLSPPGSVWHHREGISLVWSSGREIKCFQVLKMLLVAPLKTLGCYTLTNVSLTSACDLIFKSPDTFLFSWFLSRFVFVCFSHGNEPWISRSISCFFFSLQPELNFWSQSTGENERFPEMFDLNCRSLFLNPLDWLC